MPPQGGASMLESVVNFAKVCLGMGMLALPNAFTDSGVGLGALGLALLGCWNVHASRRLVQLRAASGRNTYAALALGVFGRPGRVVVEICTIATLLGALTVYSLTFAELVHETPLALGPGGKTTATWREALLFVALVAPLCVWRQLRILAKTSALGLLALLGGFAAIFAFGAIRFGADGLGEAPAGWEGYWDADERLASGSAAEGVLTPSPDGASNFNSSTGGGGVVCANGAGSGALPVLPPNAQSAARYFGVAAFCYGIPPLQFSLQDSMANPDQFTAALRSAL